MLEHLFGSKTRVKLLQFFAREPERRMYVRELTRAVGAHLNAVRRELTHLQSLGLVIVEDERGGKEKRKKFIRANEASTLWDELRGIILKGELLGREKLAGDIQRLGSIEYLMVTGRLAGDPEAPTDLLIVGDAKRNDLLNLVKRFERDFGKDIRYTLMSGKEFLYRRNVADKFLSDLLSRKHVVVLDSRERSERQRAGI